MRWRGRRESSNIEDRRGGGSSGGSRFGRGGRIRLPSGSRARRASGSGIGGIILLVVAYFGLKMVGIDLLQFVDLGGQQPSLVSNEGQTNSAPARDDETKFVGVVLAETEDTWNGIFKARGETYPEPKLVLFSDQVRSACGFASSASGPFYCPGDNQVYIDLTFFKELATRFDAAGDFAQAYVIAHEVGHHVQNVIGVLPKFNEMRRSGKMNQKQQNQMSIRVELQADCFAGIWAHYTEQKGLLERGDLEEALNAATQIGDDAIQKRTRGFVVPESFNHGTSEQRRRWFRRGFDAGRMDACNTFSANAL